MDDNCEACGRWARIFHHHIVTRGAGGSDEDVNLIDLCLPCHTEVHVVGRDTFAELYHLEERFEEAIRAHQFARQ